MRENVKSVGDLGAAAYLLMHDYRPLGRRGRDIVFSLSEERTEDKFRRLTMDYLASEFHRFDSCIMSLKKINDCLDEADSARFVTDLGAAAYLLMHKFKPVGRKAKAIYFEVDSSDKEKFEELALEYLTSDFHRFDSCLMSLKKLGDYVVHE